jgi:hypothetical protein
MVACYICIHVYKRAHVCVCECSTPGEYIYICMYVCMYVCICIYVCVYNNMLNRYIHVHMCVCVYAYITEHAWW